MDDTPAPPLPFAPPPGFQRGDVDTGDRRVNCWRRGTGKPLLVLHGVTDWGLDWTRLARRVEDRLDCVLLDQRGHGYSDKPAQGYSYAGFAADAWAVIRHLGLERPAVLGHSMGGGVALALAAAHPDEIDRLLLVDPPLRLDPAAVPRPQPPIEDRRAALRQRQALGRRAMVEQLRAARPAFDAEDVANTVESTLLVSPFVYGDERAPDPAAQEAQLQALRCPTLVVRGEPERGAIVSDATAQRIRDLVPGGLARVTKIAGTGHVPQREAFDLFAAVALPFLTGDTSAPESEGGSPACFLHLVDDEGKLSA